MNPNTGRQPEISPQVPVNSSQNSSLEILASRFTILNPDKERLPELSHEMQLSSSQENSSFNGGNLRSSEIHRNIGSTSPQVDISVQNGNKKEKTALLVCPFNCGDEQQSLASLKYHIQVQHSEKILTRKISGSNESTDMQLLCPFECGADPFKTQSDKKHHLMKKHACTDKQLTLAAAQSSSSKDPKNDSSEEREANEKNNIRKPIYQTQKV